MHKNIRLLRIDAGLTQEELAARIGVPRSTICQWELGTAKPRVGALRKLAHTLGVAPSIIAEYQGGTHGLMCEMGDVSQVPLDQRSTDNSQQPAGALRRRRQVEVPAFIIEAHPRARAVIIDGSCVNPNVPHGMVAVYDPDLKPGDDSLVLQHDAQGCGQAEHVMLRQWDLARLGIPTHQLLGTVLWLQTARMLA